MLYDIFFKKNLILFHWTWDELVHEFAQIKVERVKLFATIHGTLHVVM